MAIYPIPCSDRLTVGEIAEHWAKEIQPPSTVVDLRNDIVREWWRGRLVVQGDACRLRMLTVIYKHHDHNIVFCPPDHDNPLNFTEFPDGGVQFDDATVVPIPDEDSEKWAEFSCEPAFQVMAESWDYRTIGETAPLVDGMQVSEAEFSSWLLERGTSRPSFWAKPTRRSRQVSDEWTPEKIEEWIDSSGHTNGKVALKAFLALPHTKNLTRTFEAIWRKKKPGKPGRPKKSV